MRNLKITVIHVVALIIIFSIHRKLEKSSKTVQFLSDQSKQSDYFDFGKSLLLKSVS